MKKTVVKICMGTTCFVMGASELQELEEIIPKKFGNSVDIQGVTCLDYCSSCSESQAPYVLVDDEVVNKATVEKVMEVIERKLKNGQE